MGLEVTTIALVVFVLGVKWFTTFHMGRLRTRLVTAENICRRNEKRFRTVHDARKSLEEQTEAMQGDLDGIDIAVQELSGELFEVDQRNSEIRDQIEGKGQ